MSTKRILLIDDEKRLAKVIEICLRKIGGWILFTAHSGDEGLHKAQMEQPDAILLDVMMPDMDGLTLLEKLKDNPVTQNIPVVLLTAKVQLMDYEKFAQLNIVGVIIKPFDPLRLADQITDALGWES